jgi:hypothetical protein
VAQISQLHLIIFFDYAFFNFIREIIRNSVNAQDDCNVLFVGSGSTGAIHKLIGILNLTAPPVI